MSRKKQKQKPKRADKKLTKRINLRVTEEEYALLELACDQDDRSLSNWARRTLVKSARQQTGDN